MVKVTIEDDRCKNEITGEFFMGLMITEEEKTEDSTTYKACAIGTGNTPRKSVTAIIGLIPKTQDVEPE